REESGSTLNFRQLLTYGIIDNNLFTYIGVVDEDGNLALGSEPFKPTNLSDREWFKVHQRESSDAPFLGKPLLGRVTGKWAFQLSRRIDKPDGSFGGVVYASVDPAYFSKFYRQADLGEEGLAPPAGLTRLSGRSASDKRALPGKTCAKVRYLRNMRRIAPAVSSA